MKLANYRPVLCLLLTPMLLCYYSMSLVIVLIDKPRGEEITLIVDNIVFKCANKWEQTTSALITCQTLVSLQCKACSQTTLTLTTVRIPSLVSGSVSILKCSPSSPCMAYLALHAGLFGLSLSITCSRRGEVPVSCSFTLPEPYYVKSKVSYFL